MEESGVGVRSVQAIKKAYGDRDIDESKRAHLLAVAHKESNNEESKLLKPIVFGGLDGVSTIFAFLAGAVGAELELVHIIAIGCAQLFAGALGMGFGEYLSSQAEQDVARHEQEREHWEVENNPEGEIHEMVDIYKDKGLTHEDAMIVATTLSKYKDFWVEHMMLHEVGMFPPEEDSWQSVVQGIVMFLSFMILGGLPLVAYIIAHQFSISENGEAYAVCLSSSGALLLLGMLKAYTANLSLIKGGLSMMFQGCLCAGGAYVIGNSLPQWIHLG
jgi:DNA damage-binding protein 1